jgi:hypothetical protein
VTLYRFTLPVEPAGCDGTPAVSMASQSHYRAQPGGDDQRLREEML